MKLEKRDVDFFLLYWIRNDKELWGELRQIEILLLVERIVNEKPYQQIATEHKTTPDKIQKVFEAILLKIERCISKSIARQLRVIDLKLKARPDNPFPVFEIHLN
jgi:hypothetical protein